MRHARTRRTPILIVAFLTTASNSGLAQDADLDTLAAQAKPEIQEQIKRVLGAFPSNVESDVITNCTGFRELGKLKSLTDDKAEIVKQLAIFAVTQQYEENSQVILARFVLDLLDFPPPVIIGVLAPYVDTNDPRLRDFARDWFRYHDSHNRVQDRRSLGSDNYYDYVQYVGKKLSENEEIPAGFIEYIYERHPDKALLVFAYAHRQLVTTGQLLIMRKQYDAARQGRGIAQNELDQERRQQKIREEQASKEKREILLAEHIVSNAVWLQANRFDDRFQKSLPEANAELAKLAEHNEWWVRLYVAETMRQQPALRQPAILERLAKDGNALVSKSAKKVK